MYELNLNVTTNIIIIVEEGLELIEMSRYKMSTSMYVWCLCNGNHDHYPCSDSLTSKFYKIFLNIFAQICCPPMW
jgi:hypothetical protein